ncbi:MAG TPA: flavin reductase family protein [Thermoflexales bacterium]|nr:flavin reductase family protein [Thermoflexales bacterium]HQW35161.1 flavin reductase family protein [Thermoflexales bacterium]HQZ23456.1 flavin reductase family protein [Thermoflexales bacterium]
MMMTPDIFKSVMRRWTSTVNVVTTQHDTVIHGLTVTAFSSLSMEPPMAFASINRHTRTHALITASGIFCVNILSEQMKNISDRFAGRMNNEDRFAGLAHHVALTGAPVLDDAIAYLDCRVVNRHDEGDHTLFIGQVVAAAVQHPDGRPLLYGNGQYLLPGLPA